MYLFLPAGRAILAIVVAFVFLFIAGVIAAITAHRRLGKPEINALGAPPENDGTVELDRIGSQFFGEGVHAVDSGSLHAAVRIYQTLAARYQSRSRAAWATAQSNLGAALSALGERQPSLARLQQAIEAHEHAL